MANPYLLYVEEKDPRDTYEVASYFGDWAELAISFLFRKCPNKVYWDRLIIPELKRMAFENSQSIVIHESSEGGITEIDIKPPNTYREPTCLRRRLSKTK